MQPLEAPAPTGLAPAAQGQRLGPLRRTVREVGLALIVAGIIVFLFVAYQLFGTNITAAHNQAALKKDFAAAITAHRASPASSSSQGSGTGAGAHTTPPPSGGDSPTVGGASTTSAATASGAIDHLVIPRIGLDRYVVDGTNEADLSQGPGHYLGTPYPGHPGNVGIAGHRTTYGAPFYRLNELAVGDDIEITDTTGATYTYQVAQAPFVVSPNDVGVLDPTKAATLTLTTCNPRFSATSRLVVKALLRSTAAAPAPAPASTPTTVAAAPTSPSTVVPTTAGTAVRSLTGGNDAAWPQVIVYGIAVVVGWVLTRLGINRARRLARAGAFVAGVGVCLVPLWFCFENVVRLLPQSI